MIPAPDIDLTVLAPVGFTAIGSMVVLVGEVLLSRATTFLGRPATETYIGTVLAATTMFFLALAFYASVVSFGSRDISVFHAGNPMFQLDPFSSLMSAMLALAAAITTALSVAYLAELRINHGEYYLESSELRWSLAGRWRAARRFSGPRSIRVW